MQEQQVKNNLSPNIMNRIFSGKLHTYNLRNNTYFKSLKIKTVKYGTETISFRGPKFWKLVPCIQESSSLEGFIKQWKPVGCTCRLYIYIYP